MLFDLLPAVGARFRQKLQPDVRRDAKPLKWRARLQSWSSRLSHAVFLGLIAIALTPRPTALFSIAAPSQGVITIAPIELAQVGATSASQRDVSPIALGKTATTRDVIKSVRSAPPERLNATARPPEAAAKIVEPEALPLKAQRIARVRAKTIETEAVEKAEVDPPREANPREANPQSKPQLRVVMKPEIYTVVNDWTEDQISDARQACSVLLKGVDMVATDAPPIKEGACGAPAPVEVRSVGAPKVSIQPSAMLTCPMAAALNTWITDKVQPAAMAHFGAPVVRLLSASSYSCRNRYGKSEAPLSEHAVVNALDLSGFILADGRTVRVVDSWGPVARDPDQPLTVALNVSRTPMTAGISRLGGAVPKALVDAKVKVALKTPTAKELSVEKNKQSTTEEQAAKDAASRRAAFLHNVHDGACGIFGTVLGPEANDAHRDHFHLDMKARKRRAYCQ